MRASNALFMKKRALGHGASGWFDIFIFLLGLLRNGAWAREQ